MKKQQYNITISSWYGEPNVKFNISHKIILLLRETIINEFLIPNDVFNKESDSLLGITITTNSETTLLKLGEPEIDVKNNLIDYKFWLPYKEINNPPNVKKYLHCFFYLLKQFLIKLDLAIYEFEKIELEVTKEVLNNSKYQFEEVEKLPDIGDILKELGL